MAKVMISLPDQMKREVDRRAALVDSTRSEFIREALRDKLLADIRHRAKISEARKKRMRAIFKSWREMGNKYKLSGLSELVIREREKLAKKKY